MQAELRRHMTADEKRKHEQLRRLNHAHGFITREQGQGREVCPAELDEEMRAHWLSGWLDCDQELDTRREA
jgi:ribosome modulation factor